MTTHGHGSRVKGISPTYNSWRAMIERCSNENNKAYRHYGGRGIKVCVRWRQFANFLKDMGERPSGHTLGRKNNDGGYKPSNCRWETIAQQKTNSRQNLLLTVGGTTQSVIQWQRQLGFPNRDFIYRRVYRGWSHERAIFQPKKEAA